jgi:hypothetical protein
VRYSGKFDGRDKVKRHGVNYRERLVCGYEYMFGPLVEAHAVRVLHRQRFNLRVILGVKYIANAIAICNKEAFEIPCEYDAMDGILPGDLLEELVLLHVYNVERAVALVCQKQARALGIDKQVVQGAGEAIQVDGGHPRERLLFLCCAAKDCAQWEN